MSSLYQICPDHFMELLARGEWDRARVEFERDPLLAIRSVTMHGFLGSDKLSRVTPMHQACAHKAPVSFIQQLHALYPKFLTTRDSLYKRLPLHVALMTSATPDVLHEMLGLDMSTAQGEDILGRFPLHYACNHGAAMSVVERLLLVYPSAVSKADYNGWLPLHVACRFGMPLAVIRLLVEKCPASIHWKTLKGTTALLYAKRTKKQPLIDFLQAATLAIPWNGSTAACAATTSNQDTAMAEESKVTCDFFDLPTPFQPSDGPKTPTWMSLDVERRSQCGTPSVVSELTASPTQTNRKRLTFKLIHKEELANLAFSPHSPYMDDKHVRMPFLSEKIGLS